MKVLIAHVKYRQRGGEDAVVEREEQLLRDSGIDVATLILDSTLFDELPLLDRVAIALSQGSHEFGRSAMRAAIGQHRPDVVHAHNLFPLLGPGALLEAASSGCATVHTWHNYRASCLAGTHLRGGEICRLCDVTRRASGVVRGCYRGSRLQSLAFDRGVRTQIAALAAGVPDAVLCLTDFQRRFYASQGIPADRLLLKPNSVARGAPGPWPARDGAVFVGRLSPEKGILGLLRTWPLDAPRLRVIGDGPLLDPVRSLASGQPNIVVLGPQSPGDVRQAIREARVLAFPSVWYEGLPLTVLESMSEGTPVVTFRGGAVEGVAPGAAAGAGDFGMLADLTMQIATAEEARWSLLSADTADIFNERYTDERNLLSLIGIYEDVLSRER